MLKYLGGRWVTLYHPARSSVYTRDYYTNLKIDENGLNRLRISRNKDWITISVNGVKACVIAGEGSLTEVQIEVSNLEIDYRWVEKNFEFGKFTEMELEGGTYHESNALYTLNDGDIVRVFFNPRKVNRDPDWANSLVFFVDNTALWMNNIDGTYKFDYQLDDAEDNSDMTPHELKKGMNYLDIKRQGNSVKLFLNGKFLRVYRHIALHRDAWPVRFKSCRN